MFELLKLSCSGSMIHFVCQKNNQLFKQEQPGISHCVSEYIYYLDHNKTVFINLASLCIYINLLGLWGKIAK